MTALPVSGVRPSMPVASAQGLAAGVISAFRKAASRLNTAEKTPATTARGQAAAFANPLMRDHGSMLQATL